MVVAMAKILSALPFPYPRSSRGNAGRGPWASSGELVPAELLGCNLWQGVLPLHSLGHPGSLLYCDGLVSLGSWPMSAERLEEQEWNTRLPTPGPNPCWAVSTRPTFPICQQPTLGMGSIFFPLPSIPPPGPYEQGGGPTACRAEGQVGRLEC